MDIEDSPAGTEPSEHSTPSHPEPATPGVNRHRSRRRRSRRPHRRIGAADKPPTIGASETVAPTELPPEMPSAGESNPEPAAEAPAAPNSVPVPEPASPHRPRRSRHRRGRRHASPRPVAIPPQPVQELIPQAPPAEAAVEAVVEAIPSPPQVAPLPVEAPVVPMARVHSGMRHLRFPGLDTTKARQIIGQQLHETLDTLGQNRLVLGLSGGLDSALMAALLVESVGSQKLHLVHYLDSEQAISSKALAELVAKQVRCALDVYDLRPHLRMIWDANPSLSENQRQERISRERMAALYTLADKQEAVVVGSMNKTKMLLGRGTIFGDLAFAFNPLEDLYRTQVRELARAMRIPPLLLDKAQKADEEWILTQNGPAALNAKLLDFYLYQMVDLRLALSHLLTLGAQEDVLRWLYHRLRDSARQHPVMRMADAKAAYVPRAGVVG